MTKNINISQFGSSNVHLKKLKNAGVKYFLLILGILSIPMGPFRIWTKIRGDIRNFVFTSLFCTDSANIFYQPPSSLPRNRGGGEGERDTDRTVKGCHPALGPSDFPRSLCFMWFWFGLEILRLVYKKAFFKILNGFYLIWGFNFQKNRTVP